MKKFAVIFLILSFQMRSQSVKILFDATKAETAGNADWVIDTDLNNIYWNPNAIVGAGTESNPQRFPTPGQSGITSSTSETYWNGSLSNWGIDCAKRGYSVETLPYNGQITYGNSSNLQDLSHYKIFVVDEPNILFSSSEKAAMMNFVLNGGSLFMISDHDVSDRNNDGYDSPAIWNDFISNNGVQNNALGFSVDLANISQTSSNIVASASDSIIHGPMGNVTQVKWSNGTTMTLHPTQNSSVKGVVYSTGSSGNSGVLCAYSHIGCGKVAIIGDSSPTDDGTGDPNDVLYNGYTADASGNHQKLLMNIIIWMASNCSTTTGIKTTYEAENIVIFPNPAKAILNVANAESADQLNISDVFGKVIFQYSKPDIAQSIDLSSLPSGIYFVTIIKNGIQHVTKIIH